MKKNRVIRLIAKAYDEDTGKCLAVSTGNFMHVDYETSGGKTLVLELFIQGLHLHVLYAPTGTHFRCRANQSCQLIGGEEDFFHQFCRLDVTANAVPVTAYGVYQFRGTVDFGEEFRGFLAVLFGPLFKVHVMEQSGARPEVGIVTEPEFLCVPAHDALNGQGVPDVERFMVILFEQGKGLSLFLEMSNIAFFFKVCGSLLGDHAGECEQGNDIRQCH